MRGRREGGLRQPLVRRASLPDRVLGLAVPGGPARRAEPDDQADPDRLRRVHPAVSPSGAGGRARRHARPAHRRPHRARHRPLQRLRADRPGDRPARHARDVGRVHHDAPQHLAVGRVLLGRAVLEGAARAACCPSRSRSRTRACIWPAPRPRASTWPPTRASACCRPPPTPRPSWPSTSSATGRRVKQATPVGAFVNEFWGNNVHAFCGENNKEARELAALSLKTFFGPDKPVHPRSRQRLRAAAGVVGRRARSPEGRLRALAPAVRRGAQGAGRAGRHLARQRPGRRAGGLRPDGPRHARATAASSSPAIRRAASRACSSTRTPASIRSS